MEEGNVGYLLHKLTKYQTLLQNGSSDKSGHYQEKINQYNSKLEKLGVEKSNLNRMNGIVELSGGSIELLKKLVEEQTNKVMQAISEKTVPVGLGGPVGPTLDQVVESVDSISNNIDSAKTKYNDNIKDLVGLIRHLLKNIDELEQKISGIPNIKGDVDLGPINTAITRVKGKLEQMVSENIIRETYATLIIDTVNANKDKYIAGDTPTDALREEITRFATFFDAATKKEDMKALLEDPVIRRAIDELA